DYYCQSGDSSGNHWVF
nr:immunoglobulin light chain junction region [Macaca mulatta]MOV67056.1 immunoglobulin light chain junction region [Macaca mulatta]MOV68586.1 immunoglobulin light chain junction region [Macaca mulatta]MOV68797.1 immunoglobulin light chain junction region [Macaca mulatta]MOV68811.1 immunoglobulin light chain junction region [Macaca mulatta]